MIAAATIEQIESNTARSVPELSVVVASARPFADLEMCLAELVQQASHYNVEIIVADCGSDRTLEKLEAGYPQITFIKFNERTTLPVLWGGGIARATGNIVAVTDSSCVVDDRWMASIFEAHQSLHPIIGGNVEVKSKRRSLVDWAAYFCEYGQFMHPRIDGVVNELPGNNVSFKRSLLKEDDPLVGAQGFWKTYWCQRLQREGVQLVSASSIIVYDQKSYQLWPFLVRRFHHGRCFAGMRVGRDEKSKRFFYVVSSPLLPLVFSVRTIKAIVSKRRLLKEFILSFPVSLLAIFMWSLGEFCGYLRGAGGSCSLVY